MEKPYYTNAELILIAENCNSIVELSNATEALKYIHEETNEIIFLSGFNILAHFKIRQLLKIKKKP